MKRFLIFVLTATLLLCLGTAALAESEDATGAEPRNSSFFSRYGTSLTPTGSGNVTLTFSCTATGVVSQLGVSGYTVQRLDDSGWTDVTGLLPGSMASNTSNHSFSKNFHGVAGEKYRVTCTFFCVKSDGTSESKFHTSGTVTAK